VTDGSQILCAAKKEEEVFNFACVDWEERERSGKDEKVRECE
jgi:hypothetical protein